MRVVMKQITPSDRRRLSALCGVNEQYLYQCLTERRDMSPAVARLCETVSNGELMRWDLCSQTWHKIWPELIGAEGAPPVPESAKAA